MSRKYKIIVVFLSIFLLSTNIVLAGKKHQKRPKVGLALSGGGAKGLVYVGVLKVIEEVGIPIDYIAGTSMGAIIGALYSIGYDAKSLEKVILETSWEKLLSDNISRVNLSLEEKKEHGKYVGEFPISKGRIVLPRGLVAGQNILSLFSRLTLPAHHIKDFKKLPIPFVCLATDIERGEPVVLDKGYLADALRASMAISSIVTPVELDGKLLVDGGLVRNFPVSNVKDMGADIIIGVDVGSTFYSKQELDSIEKIMEQSLNTYIRENNQRQKALCDVLIVPNLKGYNASSFDKTVELIKLGETVARENLPKLKKIARRLKKYPIKPVESLVDKLPKKIKIKAIEIKGLNNVSKNLVLGRLNIKAPARVTPDEIDEAIKRVYGSQYFQLVSYRLKYQGKKKILVIRVVERNVKLFRFGLNYDSNMKSALWLNTVLHNALGLGSKLSLEAFMGENPGASGFYFIHSGKDLGLGINLGLDYRRFKAFRYLQGNLIDYYDLSYLGANFNLQSTFSNTFAIGGGLQKEWEGLNATIAGKDPGYSRSEYLNLLFFLKVDTLDRTFYPSKGVKLFTDFKWITNQLPLEKSEEFKDFKRISLTYLHAFPLSSEASLLGNVYAGTTMGDSIPISYLFYFGGLATIEGRQFPFIGLDFLEKASKNVLIIGLELQYEFMSNYFIKFKGDLGEAEKNLENIFRFKDIIYGYGITMGTLLPIGPLEITMMRGKDKRAFLFYFNLGYKL